LKVKEVTSFCLSPYFSTGYLNFLWKNFIKRKVKAGMIGKSKDFNHWIARDKSR